ncbi:unnamed protein product [marine sediment metagenome]|uniref:Uncharacterized protein n=1 Tax=marine sediment metagenome TaxID=412755 RepID=X0S3U6_9ZZZZ
MKELKSASLLIFLNSKTINNPIIMPKPNVGRIAINVPNAKPDAIEWEDLFSVAISFRCSFTQLLAFSNIKRHGQDSNLSLPKEPDFCMFINSLKRLIAPRIIDS